MKKIKFKKDLRRAVKIASFLLVSIFLLTSIFFASLQTESIRTAIKESVISYAKEKDIDLSIGSIEGSLPFSWTIHSVEIKAKEGTKLSIERALVRFDFFALFRRAISINSLSLESGKLELVKTSSAELSEQTLPSLYTLPWNIRIKNIRAKNFEIQRQDAKEATSLDLSASLVIKNKERFFSFNFKTIGSFPLELYLQGQKETVWGSADLKLNIPNSSSPTLHAVINGALKEEMWKGRVDLSMQQHSFALKGDSSFTLDSTGYLRFDEIQIESPDAKLGGNLNIKLMPLGLDGALFGHALNLHRFRPLFPKIHLEGSAGLDLRFISSEDQKMHMHLQFKDAQLAGVRAKELWLDAKLSHLFDEVEGALALEGEEIHYQKALISSLSARGGYEKEKGTFELTSRGALDSSFEIAASGDWERRKESTRVNIEKLSGFMQKNAFFLEKPCAFVFGSNELEISAFKLHAGQGYFAADARLTKESAEIKVAGKEFPLELIPLPQLLFHGKATFSGELSAQTGKIEGKGDLLIEEATLTSQGKKEPFRTRGTLLAHIADGKLQLHAHMRARGEQFLEWSATLPLEYKLSPFSLSLNPNKPISSELITEGELEEIFDFVSAHSHRATGLLTAHLFLSNTLADPRMLGSFEVQNGTYENYFTGTDLQEISVKGEASGKTINFLSAKAKDSQGGTIDAKGSLILNLEKRLPYLFTAELDRCRFINFEMISAKFTGPVEMEGNLDGADVRGTLAIYQANLNIPEKLPIDLPVLPMTFVNEPPHLSAVHLPPVFPFRLDLNLSAPGKIFIKGKGLDSEWQGSVHLMGTNMIFRGAGTLTLVKGSYAFAGKTFELTQGEVTFSDKANLSSYLNLTGTLVMQETTVFAHLKGPVLSPNLTFESRPHMPTSSLLSLILFNKDISEISPFQAIQIAQTIVSMSGGAGPNVLEAIRKSLGVDRLSIISGKEGSDAVSVQIGKYLTRGVMVTLVQGTSSSQVQVEVDLKNGFVLVAETQEEEEGKFTLKWNKNY